ncbi:S1 family peptidase [Gigaspora margarita]|uniref:S1 family peptidase n=1 Tax=Gigaspora margarita TaxID=4874 RepID=A0A8H3WTS7_GIGMA|nr:S1 family peptidase [Gigaspora margarita]
MGYINSKINNIIIASCNETRNEKSNAAFINAVRKYYPNFIYYNCFGPSNNELPSLKSYDIEDKILAGDGIFNDNDGVGICSVGFWARQQPNKNFIATAGHCHAPRSYYLVPWNSTPTASIGRMKNYFLEPIDFGLINIENSDVQPVPSVRNTDSALYNELFIKDIIPVSSNGAHLCLSGVKSHVKCGYVAALNGFTSNGRYFRENIFVVNLRGKPGDSGGPIFSYKNLMDR